MLKMTFLILLTYIFYFSIKVANFWYTACPVDYKKKKWHDGRNPSQVKEHLKNEGIFLKENNPPSPPPLKKKKKNRVQEGALNTYLSRLKNLRF